MLLRELVRNLVDNALQYTPAGGTVTARVVTDPFGQVLVLQVEDTGPGVPVAEREMIFRPFYRALGTNVDGTGLGLAIVQEIVQQHDAEISVTGRTRAPGHQPGCAVHGAFPGAAARRRLTHQGRRGGHCDARRPMTKMSWHDVWRFLGCRSTGSIPGPRL